MHASAPTRDPQLWTLARARATFKSQLVTYTLVSLLLWLIWFVTGHPTHGLPWPVWVTGFWGLGLLAKGLNLYGPLGGSSWSEREYQQLLRQREQGR